MYWLYLSIIAVLLFLLVSEKREYRLQQKSHENFVQELIQRSNDEALQINEKHRLEMEKLRNDLKQEYDAQYCVAARKEAANALISSNKTAIPWLSGMMADYLTYDLEVLSRQLDLGINQREKRKLHPFEKYAKMQKRKSKPQKKLFINSNI